jgi:hypothetical protein
MLLYGLKSLLLQLQLLRHTLCVHHLLLQHLEWLLLLHGSRILMQHSLSFDNYSS